MKAPLDELPVPCRSQGKHGPPGALQVARMQGLHRHQPPQRQPTATATGLPSAYHCMEQLFLHSKPPQNHSRPQAEPRRSSRSKQRKRRGAKKRLQNKTPETPTGRSWVSSGVAAALSMASQAAGTSWASPEATLDALSNAAGTLSNTKTDAAFSGTTSSRQQGTSLGPAVKSASDPKDVSTGTRIDLRCSVPVQGTPPCVESYDSMSSSVAQRVVDAVIGETLELVELESRETGRQEDWAPMGYACGATEYSEEEGQSWSSSVSEAGGVAADDIDIDDGLAGLQQQRGAEWQMHGPMHGSPRIFPGLDLCAEHSITARRHAPVPARQRLWRMQARF